MKYWCSILLFFASFGLSGQQYFNKTVDYQNGAEFARTVIPTDTGYFIFGFTHPIGNPYKLNVIFLDLNGNLIFQKSYGNDLISFTDGVGASFKTSAYGGFVGGGLNRDQTNNDNFSLYRINHKGDSIFFKSYGSPSVTEVAYDVAEMPDGGFVLAGVQGDYFAKTMEVRVIRTDSTGNVLWDTIYGGSGNDIGIKVAYIGNNQIAIGAGTYSFGNYPGAPWLFVINDLNRKIQWQKIFTGKWYSGGAYFNLTNDSGYILCANKDTIISGNQISDIAFIKKLDPFGNVEWEKDFITTYYRQIWMARQSPDGGFLYCGETRDSNNNELGYVGKLDSAGGLLWERTYYFKYGMPHYLADIQPTADGMIAVGMTHNSTQDAWVLKLDHKGCLIPGCDTITGMDDFKEIPPTLYKIFPNPASDFLNIELPKQNENLDIEIRLWDIQGKTVKELKATVTSVINIPVNDLNQGIYFLEVQLADQQPVMQKVMIAR